jgi:hypothetical protein
LIVLLAGVATYSFAGFVVAPRAIKHLLESSTATERDCQIGVQDVYVNPFTFFLSVSNVTLMERENKLFVSMGQLETHIWSVQDFRAKRAGRNVEIRDLVITKAPAGEVLLSVPKMSATGLGINAQEGHLDIADARLEEPVLQIARDGQSTFPLSRWLPLQTDNPGAACVSLGEMRVSAGQIRFTDHTKSPTMRIDATNIIGSMTRTREPGGASMALEFKGNLSESAGVNVTAQWPLSDRRAFTTLDLSVRRLELSQLSPYFAQTAGRDVIAGVADVTLHYQRRNSTVQIENQLAVDGLRLGDRAVTDGDTARPSDLALALLLDKADRVDISIPVLQSNVAATADIIRIVGNSVTDYIRDLAAKPFDVLADLVGLPDEELNHLSFSPGSAEITPTTSNKITLLARALDQRPLLGVRACPAYDPVADRDAIAAQQVRLHVALAISAGLGELTTHGLPDFDDPKVRAVLDEFAGARLTESQRLAIANRRPDQDADYYRNVYDVLVANEPVSETTLRRLARFRARSVVNALADIGIDKQRLLIADAIDTAATAAEPISVQLEAIY